MLGPIAGKPGNEVALGALVDAVLPVFHRAPREVLDRSRGGLRRDDNIAVDLQPGLFVDDHRPWCRLRRRGLGGTTGQRQGQDGYEGQAQGTQIQHRRPPQNGTTTRCVG
ncbi:hypothetical protein D3C87_1648630 [compost metagenome]